MEGRITIGVSHVDDELQQLRGDGPESSHVQRDRVWIGFYVAGKLQPTVQHCGICQFLWQGGEKTTVKREALGRFGEFRLSLTSSGTLLQ